MNQWKNQWFPIAELKALKKGKALSRTLLGLPIVIFLDEDANPAILYDRCPHRFAKLSEGKVDKGMVECPYHGWKFNKKGLCTHVPGLPNYKACKRVTPPLSCCVVRGLIWCCMEWDDDTMPIVPVLNPEYDEVIITESVDCSITAVVENFLDGTHTHFVHSGWLRNDNTRKRIMAVTQEIPNGIEVSYHEEQQQKGWIPRLLEKDRVASFGRFTFPTTAEIEYQSTTGTSIRFTVWLTPVEEEKTLFFARIATQKGMVPSGVKSWILRRIFNIIIQQDKNILEQTRSNAVRFQQSGLPCEGLSTWADILSPYIQDVMHRKPLKDPRKQTRLDL